MKIGQIIDILIGIKDGKRLFRMEIEAINEACNLLENYPLSADNRNPDSKELLEKVIKQ